jgi:hypothetical protein
MTSILLLTLCLRLAAAVEIVDGSAASRRVGDGFHNRFAAGSRHCAAPKGGRWR